MNEKELAEYVIKRILDGDVFFAGSAKAISFFEKESPLKIERTDNKVKFRGFRGSYDLYFIKKDENLRRFSIGMVKGAGANFETLLGFLLEEISGVIHVHVYYIGLKFDLDKLSEMVYSLFTELGEDHIKKIQITVIY